MLAQIARLPSFYGGPHTCFHQSHFHRLTDSLFVCFFLCFSCLSFPFDFNHSNFPPGLLGIFRIMLLQEKSAKNVSASSTSTSWLQTLSPIGSDAFSFNGYRLIRFWFRTRDTFEFSISCSCIKYGENWILDWFHPHRKCRPCCANPTRYIGSLDDFKLDLHRNKFLFFPSIFETGFPRST